MPGSRRPTSASAQPSLLRLNHQGLGLSRLLCGFETRFALLNLRGRIATGIDAITELRFSGNLDLPDFMKFVASIPEVEEVLTLAADTDAVVRIHVAGVEHLRHVVSRLRAGKGVIGTKTQDVLESWSRGQPGSS